MREFKFRLWYIQQKKYDYVNLSHFKSCSFPLDWCIIEQYAGLTDKNGKEIYEGDIVKLTFREEAVIGPVQWDYLNAAFLVFGKLGCTLGIYGSEQSVEVIGNIHENNL